MGKIFLLGNQNGNDDDTDDFNDDCGDSSGGGSGGGELMMENKNPQAKQQPLFPHRPIIIKPFWQFIYKGILSLFFEFKISIYTTSLFISTPTFINISI